MSRVAMVIETKAMHGHKAWTLFYQGINSYRHYNYKSYRHCWTSELPTAENHWVACCTHKTSYIMKGTMVHPYCNWNLFQNNVFLPCTNTTIQVLTDSLMWYTKKYCLRTNEVILQQKNVTMRANRILGYKQSYTPKRIFCIKCF